MPSREYYKQQCDTLRAYQRDYYRKHRKERQEYARRYYQEHPNVQVYQATYSHNLSASLKIEVMSYYSNGSIKCAHCGFDNLNALTLDHIADNGAQQRRDLGFPKGGIRMYRWLKANDFPDGYQVLCANCNLIKELDRRRLHSPMQARGEVK